MISAWAFVQTGGQDKLPARFQPSTPRSGRTPETRWPPRPGRRRSCPDRGRSADATARCPAVILSFLEDLTATPDQVADERIADSARDELRLLGHPNCAGDRNGSPVEVTNSAGSPVDRAESTSARIRSSPSTDRAACAGRSCSKSQSICKSATVSNRARPAAAGLAHTGERRPVPPAASRSRSACAAR